MSSFSLSGGVQVIGFISPTDTNDTYPVIDPLYGIDGFRNVNSLSDLNTIPGLRRRAGMVVGIGGGSSYYKLNYGPWNYTISDWSLFNVSTAVGDYLPLSGGTVTGGTLFNAGLTANTISATSINLTTIDLCDNNGIIYSSNFSGCSPMNFYSDSIFYQGLTANTISATTYFNLPIDVFVSGGTYSAGTATFTNNTGGTFTVTGFTIGGSGDSITGGTINYTTGELTLVSTGGTVVITGFTDTFVTGGTYSSGTATFTNNTGGTFNVIGFYTGETSYVNSLTAGTGLSGSSTTGNITLINTSPDQVVTLSGGTNIATGGTYPNFSISVTGLTDNNRFVTGFTYNNSNTFTISDNSGSTYSATFNVVTGLTINGILSVTGTSNLNGSIVSANLSGTTDRMVQVNSGGTISATQEIISAYITSGGTAANNLENVSYWDINGNYTGPAITGTFQGQKHYDINYFYEAIQDNIFIRLIRG